ncbi:hypothetical protein B9Z55_017530 [Caenorhabditis nigoni]|uniref:Uncharacterized protein n=1 Tax=Caenorhabditis nigoni TaxID=1611254 RepID=A0A2G5T9I0_9PELO|nr:hypothetical protein B9Z55_017530 [Caenorhabditis nigoni]
MSVKESGIHGNRYPQAWKKGAQKLRQHRMTPRDSNNAPPHTIAFNNRTTPARKQKRSQAVKRRFSTTKARNFWKFVTSNGRKSRRIRLE